MVLQKMKDRLIYIDLLRVYLCVAIFLYHIGILKGGYLAVCSFFVLSGYLSAQALKKERFSLLSYYKSRFIRVYIPMVLVVFASLALCITLMPDTIWVSMKREVASIIFCKNNFWQLSANMDYFARHVDSPYMHLWYVAILLQLEFIFPLIFIILKFLRDKLDILFSLLLCVVIVIFSTGWFICVHMSDGLMAAYYDTLTRCFSWFAGIAVGLYHTSEDTYILEKIEGKSGKLISVFLIVVQTILFVIVAADSKLYLGSMIATTFIMCIILFCVKSVDDDFLEKTKHVIGYFSNISYEIFLVQYPVIYIFQSIDLAVGLKHILIAIITVLVSVLVNLALHPKRKKLAFTFVTVVLLLALVSGAGYGGYRYAKAPDLQAELEALEEEMARLAEEQEQKQREYEEQLRLEEEQRRKEEEERLEELEYEIADIDYQIGILEQKIENVEQTAKKSSVTFIGDSVLLGASDVLYDVFSKCYIDAEIGRTAYVIDPILSGMKERGVLGEIVVINCGSNGDCTNDVKDIIMATLYDRQVFWVTASNNKSANSTIFEYAAGYDNLHVVDWATISEGHGEYFAGDGLHLESEGKDAYAQAVLDAICEYYIEEFEAKIAELEKQKLELEE